MRIYSRLSQQSVISHGLVTSKFLFNLVQQFSFDKEDANKSMHQNARAKCLKKCQCMIPGLVPAQHSG